MGEHLEGGSKRIVKESLSTELNEEFVVPLFLNYVYWIIHEAEIRGIETLYFLARDGYILQKMAIQICEKEHIPICCNYLYCSRTSLRIPTYSLIGEEAVDLLLQGGYQVSRKSLLERAELNGEQRCAIWKDCGEALSDEERLLSRNELKRLRRKLKQSQLFRNFIIEKSRNAYSSAVGYFRQEGLLNTKTVAIVDSGWTGSIQRSLRQLLQSAGFQGDLIGFYFGMYAAPKEAKDGTYLTYYFNQAGKARNKVFFCNNLFECLLRAPHGMTVAYGSQGGTYFPQFASSENETNYEKIYAYVQAILDIAREQEQKKPYSAFELEIAQQETRTLIERYMVHPMPEEAKLLGGYLFCDDMSETYHFKLASPEQTTQLKQYSIFRRIWRRMFSKENGNIHPELYWPYGTIAFLPEWKQCWYRWNIYAWETMKYLFRS